MVLANSAVFSCASQGIGHAITVASWFVELDILNHDILSMCQ